MQLSAICNVEWLEKSMCVCVCMCVFTQKHVLSFEYIIRNCKNSLPNTRKEIDSPLFAYIIQGKIITCKSCSGHFK